MRPLWQFLLRPRVLELTLALAFASAVTSLLFGLAQGLVLNPIEEKSGSGSSIFNHLGFAIGGRQFDLSYPLSGLVAFVLLVLVAAVLVRHESSEPRKDGETAD